MEESIVWQRIVHQFNTSCSNLDKVWMRRHRVLNTTKVVKGLLHLCHGRSQQSYLRLVDQLAEDGSTICAASSFCEARAKLPSFVLGEVRRDLLDVWDETSKQNLWHGYEVYAVDGTKITLPRPLLKLGYKPPGLAHYPLGLVSMLVRLSDKMVRDINLTKHEDERHEAHGHLQHLAKGDLVVYDRGYLSFSLLTAHLKQGVEGVFRVAQGRSYLSVEEFWQSSELDKIVTVDPAQQAYFNAKRRYPEYDYSPMKLRLIKYFIGDKTYVLATTILNSDIPREHFAELYSARWGVEETYKVYKQTLELETFRSQSENGVRQEIEALTIIWNMTRMLGSLVQPKIKKSLLLCNFISLPNQFPSKYIQNH